MRTTAVLFFLLSVCTANAAERPNVIVIYADDMGYGDCAANNSDSRIPTPNIDQLAREGLRFTDAHSPSSTCTASRYGLLTGTCPARRGVVNGLTGLGSVIEEDEVTVADLLNDQGYVTWMVGKWHLGFELHGDGPGKTFDFSRPLVRGPLDCGFDSFFGLPKAPSGPPYFYIRGRHPVASPTEQTPGTRRDVRANGRDSRTAYAGGDIAPGFVPEMCNSQLCDDVVRTIREHAQSGENKPFFLYYAMLEPHVPWLPSEEFTGTSDAGPYGDYVAQLDHEVGRVLQALKESGLEHDTLVVFSSDNGAQWRSQDIEQFGHRANGVFSGSKGTPYEGGHRVPFFVRWPANVPASADCDALINHTDLFATLADLLNVDIPDAYPGNALDSYSFLSVLENPAEEHHRPGMIVTPGSYRLGRWKLRFPRAGGGSMERLITDAVLHDLSQDPAEQIDVSDEHPETKARLFADYQRFAAERTLKPLAVELAGRKRNRETPSPRSGARSNSPEIPSDLQLSEEQQASIDALNSEYTTKIAELRNELSNVLTDDQTRLRDAAHRQAVAEGKRGVALRAAADAAAGMTEEQETRIAELRQEISQLNRERRAKLQTILMENE